MDRIGQRIRIVGSHSDAFYMNGNVGTVLKRAESHGNNMWWVRFDEGQEGVDYEGNILFSIIEEECRGVWVIDFEIYEGEVEAVWTGYMDTGIVWGEGGKKKEWKPDELAEGVDILKVTEELVSQEVGK